MKNLNRLLSLFLALGMSLSLAQPIALAAELEPTQEAENVPATEVETEAASSAVEAEVSVAEPEAESEAEPETAETEVDAEEFEAAVEPEASEVEAETDAEDFEAAVEPEAPEAEPVEAPTVEQTVVTDTADGIVGDVINNVQESLYRAMLAKFHDGVTVRKDANSPTGYTATFIYNAGKVDFAAMGLSDIVRVRIYSDCMSVFAYEEQKEGTIDPSTKHDPSEFNAATGVRFPAGGNGDSAYYADMKYLGGDRWGVQIPLNSGATVYNFEVTDSEGTVKSRLDDPANPTLKNTATGIKSLSSMVYVGYDMYKQGNGKWSDRTVENPAEKAGTVHTIGYTGAAGDLRGLCVYTPYGYDENRAEPYKVLYLSHGASGDQKGNEMRWMNEGAVANIMDNLIAEGKTEPFVVVTMNNQDLGWNYDKIWAEQQLIMAKIEADFNVAKDYTGRAFAGLSMGGITTSNMLLNHADQFSYFGIWSASNTSINAKTANYLKATAGQNFVMFAAGSWDFGKSSVDNLCNKLTNLGYNPTYLNVPGAHDWETWQMIYAYAAENFFWKTADTYYAGYEAGATVEADEMSPTGFTGTFIYDPSELKAGYLESKGLADVAAVNIYSDCMEVFSYDENPVGTDIRNIAGHTPYEFDAENGIRFPAGGAGGNTFRSAMIPLSNGTFAIQIPLNSGATVYNFDLIDSTGKKVSRLDDPTNPTLWNTATGNHSLSSMVYAGYDAEKQGDGNWADRTVENPIADRSKAGTVETIGYTGAANDLRGLNVYLPAGYSVQREEPYKVLYLSHGASGDRVGNEMRWMHEGAVANIMDNLIAEGKTEPFIVVTMNNQDISFNYNKVWAEQEIIMDVIESKYNVRTDPAGRAFAGLSMGGLTTSRMLINHSEAFGYFGIWSYADVNGLTDEVLARLATENNNILMAAGDWDYLLGPVNNFAAKLKNTGINYDYLTVPGAHDWETWQMIYSYAAENFFWKGIDFNDYDAGVTVIEDEDSPTGYTAVFVFDEASLTDEYIETVKKIRKDNADPVDISGFVGNIAAVQIYSNTALLFSYDEQEAGKPLDPANTAHNPIAYEPGLLPAGGDTNGNLFKGKVNYTANMKYVGNGKWGVTIPLTSGATDYNIRLIDAEGNTDGTYLPDPANMPMQNTVSGAYSRSSMVYTPFDGDKCDVDRSYENPRTDGKTGTVTFATYDGTADHAFGIYLPAGYDAHSATPYNVLYMSHGAQNELLGSEMRWLNECAVANIMDNLEGDFIVVTVNNKADINFNREKAWENVANIINYMEANYRVGTEAVNRAFAGFSMGGQATSYILADHPEMFGYYGVWSYANVGTLSAMTEEQLEAMKNAHISVGAGDWDYLLAICKMYGDKLAEMGYDYEWLTVPGSHDWRTWQLMFAESLKSGFFFSESAYTDYASGVTVEEDENSPTGYTATFIYDPALMTEDKLAALGLADIVKVELYSDCMYYFETGSGTEGTIKIGDAFTPFDYKPGMNPASGSFAFTIELKKQADGRFAAEFPLSSGAFVYNYQLTDSTGKMVRRLDDPANPTAQNDKTGYHSLSSMVYVGYNADKQGTGDWADRTVENPVADPAKKGTVIADAYTGAAGDLRGLNIYLPAGYDADRAEKYNVLYISHGTGSDPYGEELRWLNEGAGANIMDNLGGDFVIVAMNNQDFSRSYMETGKVGQPDWDYNKIWAEQELIMAYVEENYNVSGEAAGRAFAGLSMGGATTSNMLMYHADQFSYFGIWSYANNNGAGDYSNVDGLNQIDQDALAAQLKELGTHVMFASGYWDFGRGAVNNFCNTLQEMTGETYQNLTVPAAHDWENWQLTLAYAIENFFWKEETETPDEPVVDDPTEDPTDDPTEDPTDKPTEDPTDKPEDKPEQKPENPSKPSKPSKTGDNANPAVYGLAMAAAVAATGAVVLKKKEQ